jgi:integrase
LSNQALVILKALKCAETAGLVFGVSGFSRAKKALDAAAKLSTPWCLHDLRRTCASGMARLGVAPHVVEAVLNHKSGQVRGVAAVYNRYSYSTEKRESARTLGGACRTLRRQYHHCSGGRVGRVTSGGSERTLRRVTTVT